MKKEPLKQLDIMQELKVSIPEKVQIQTLNPLIFDFCEPNATQTLFNRGFKKEEFELVLEAQRNLLKKLYPGFENLEELGSENGEEVFKRLLKEVKANWRELKPLKDKIVAEKYADGTLLLAI